MAVKRKRSSYPSSPETESEIPLEEYSADSSDFSDSDDNVEMVEPESISVDAVKSNDDVKQPAKPREVRVLKLGKQQSTVTARNTPRFSPLK